MADIKLLIVDDEPKQRQLLSGYLGKNGFEVMTAESGEDALEKYPSFFCPIALIDMKMPGMNGLELLSRLKEINPYVQVIVLTAFGSVETAVAAMKAGAYDYLTKPIEDLDELKFKLTKASVQNRLVVDNQVMSDKLAEIYTADEIIGESEPINNVKELITKVGPKDATVLITGPSGTGKELVARALHAISHRGSNRLVAINCAAFPENLLESELFGYEKGAFTGATKQKLGRFELAHGGTLFLDEIGEMPMSMQVKLLRVLEERKLERLGGVSEINLDIRLIAATNRNLELMVKEKTFREDLYYRLNVIKIDLPPLTERRSDIILLANLFIEKFAKRIGKEIKGITTEAVKLLTAYDWPGNVRELENVIERAIVLSENDKINTDDLSGLTLSANEISSANQEMTLSEMEKKLISSTLKRLNWSMAQTSEKLGIHRNTLRLKIKEYKLIKPD